MAPLRLQRAISGVRHDRTRRRAPAVGSRITWTGQLRRTLEPWGLSPEAMAISQEMIGDCQYW